MSAPFKAEAIQAQYEAMIKGEGLTNATFVVVPRNREHPLADSIIEYVSDADMLLILV